MALRVGFQVLAELFHDHSIISIWYIRYKMQKCGFPWILWSHFESVTLNQVGVDQNGEVVTKSAEYSKYEELVTIVQKYEEVMTKSAWYHVSISYIPTSGNWQNIALLAFLAKSMFMFTLFLAFDPHHFHLSSQQALYQTSKVCYFDPNSWYSTFAYQGSSAGWTQRQNPCSWSCPVQFQISQTN